MKRIAICVGLTNVDPRAYGGWNGYCPGCDTDAANMAVRCNRKDFTGIQVFINECANFQFIKNAFIRTSQILRKNDLLILYNSGHGGQIDDVSGDEADGKDETLCWWGGQVSDDIIGQYLNRLKPGVKVLYITDTCNSGTNYRGLATRRASTPVKLKENPFKGRLVHFGGCEDGRSSYGSEDGGVFTNALIATLGRARKAISYKEWFDRTCELMPSYQKPVMNTFRDDFSHLEMLT